VTKTLLQNEIKKNNIIATALLNVSGVAEPSERSSKVVTAAQISGGQSQG
jgi:hypothetical protein